MSYKSPTTIYIYIYIFFIIIIYGYRSEGKKKGFLLPIIIVVVFLVVLAVIILALYFGCEYSMQPVNFVKAREKLYQELYIKLLVIQSGRVMYYCQ